MEQHFNFDCCGNPLVRTFRGNKNDSYCNKLKYACHGYYAAVCLGVGGNLKSSLWDTRNLFQWNRVWYLEESSRHLSSKRASCRGSHFMGRIALRATSAPSMSHDRNMPFFFTVTLSKTPSVYRFLHSFPQHFRGYNETVSAVFSPSERKRKKKTKWKKRRMK
jgi:hypothetical protein